MNRFMHVVDRPVYTFSGENTVTELTCSFKCTIESLLLASRPTRLEQRWNNPFSQKSTSEVGTNQRCNE